MPHEPTYPYGVSETTCELYVKVFAKKHLLETIGLRYFNDYGSRQNDSSGYSGVIPYFLRLAKK
ncbi:MAG: NAD-dependent epimerase/dehydratase family protein [Candidatus Helarchaeota archaeon]